MWVDLGVLLALAAAGALLWPVFRPEEAPPPAPVSWRWAKVAERHLPEPVPSLASGNVAGNPAPEIVAGRFVLAGDLTGAFEEREEGREGAWAFAARFGRGPGGGRVELEEDRHGDTLRVLDEKKRVLWSSPLPGVLRMARWGDVDGDGVDDLAVASFFGEERWDLSLLDGRDGKPRWTRQVMSEWIQVIPGDGVYVIEFSTGRVFRFSSTGQSSQALNGPGNRTHRFVAARIAEGGDVQILGSVTDPNRLLGGLKSAMRLEARWRSGRYAWSVRDETKESPLLIDPDVLLSSAPPAIHAADLDGDGAREWILQDRADRLLVKSASGRELAIFALEGASCWTVAEGTWARLVIGEGTRLTAWEAAP